MLGAMNRRSELKLRVPREVWLVWSRMVLNGVRIPSIAAPCNLPIPHTTPIQHAQFMGCLYGFIQWLDPYTIQRPVLGVLSLLWAECSQALPSLACYVSMWFHMV